MSVRMDVYSQREDSELLLASVREYARGRVVDVGAGSGVQALGALALDTVTHVIALDRNPAAVAHVQAQINALPHEQRARITVLHSDLFSAVPHEQFDTIICNPPYLPDDAEQPDVALDGGPQGYEWSLRFLKEARAHLAPGGQILFLFSNLTNQARIDSALKELQYRAEQVGELAMFFERLYVYRIWTVS